MTSLFIIKSSFAMSRLLERWKREKEEKEARKAAREAKRKEREKEKLRLKRERHHKVVRSRQNRRYYKKVRAKRLKEREKNGDVYGYYMVLLMKNKKRIGKIGKAWWKSQAYKLFNDSIAENRAKVKYPEKITKLTSNGGSRSNLYEIIIVQRVDPDASGENVTFIRDEHGRFIEHVVIDNDRYIILDKAEWYIEEKFNVYGYHPIKDRKSFDFIMENIILNDLERDTCRRIFTFRNRLVVQYDSDFDFITCKNAKESERLYDTIEKEAKGNPYLLFTGRLSKDMSNWFLDEMVEKTGWSREACARSKTL